MSASSSKTIALFGGTGRTGRLFLQKALAAGYSVQALARNPGAVTSQSPNLKVIAGDVLNANDVAQTITGAHIVVSLFGQVKDSPKDVQTRGTENIIAAMKSEGIKRIISLSGGGLPFPEKDQPGFMDKLIRTIMKIAVPHVLTDAAGHHEALAKSGLSWTIVRGPRLTDDAEKGTYRVGWVGVNGSTKIGRADLASFILTQVEDKTFDSQMPFVSY